MGNFITLKIKISAVKEHVIVNKQSQTLDLVHPASRWMHWATR